MSDGVERPNLEAVFGVPAPGAPDMLFERAERAERVLLVDDRDDNLMALEAVLAPLGYELVTARSGADALRMLLDTDVSAIVLDVQMPDMDGFETAALLRSREATRTIPIIFLTAVGLSIEHELRGYEVGAHDYVCKPFEPRVLQSKVRAAVRWGTELSELRHASRVYQEAAEAFWSLDPLSVPITATPTGRPVAGTNPGPLLEARRVVSLELDASLGAPAQARRAVRDALAGEAAQRLDTLVLLVSELLANAVLHAGSQTVLRVDMDEATVRVEVDDEAPDLAPQPGVAGAATEGGRGLQLVSVLARRAGWIRTQRGKTVWFELTRG